MTRSSVARRSYPMTANTVLYRGEGDTETEIEVEVCGLIEPYSSGDWHEPPSGGGVDGIRAIFYDGKKQREIQVSSEEVKKFSDELVETAMDYEPNEPDDNYNDDVDGYDELEPDDDASALDSYYEPD